MVAVGIVVIVTAVIDPALFPLLLKLASLLLRLMAAFSVLFDRFLEVPFGLVNARLTSIVTRL